MLRLLLRRVPAMVPTLLLVSLMVFGLQKLLPGDPAVALAGEEHSPAVIAFLRAKYHLNDPWPQQYLHWLADVLRGDFGVSIRTQLPIGPTLAERLPVTLELAVLAMLVAVAIGLPAGILAALRRGSVLDWGASVFGLLGLSVPVFWLGIMLILVFSVHLHWLPSGGFVPLGASLWGNLASLAMPALVLGCGTAAILMRHTRSAMLQALRQDYIRTARAKGVSGRDIVRRHALPNALIPVVTLGTLQFGEMLAGAILTEQVFGIPGFGKMIVDGVFSRDYAVVQAVVLCTALAFLLLSLVADLAYMALNPRLRA